MKILIIIKKWEGGVGRVIASIKPILEKEHEVEIISREDDLKIFSMKESINPLRELVGSKDYDILYTQDWSIAFPLLSFKNHYCCFHGIEPKHPIYQKYVYWRMKNKIIVVGDKLKKIFPKATLIYNGVDFNEFKDLKLKRNYIGWIDKETEGITKEQFLEMAKKENLKSLIAKGIPPRNMNEFYNKLKVFLSLPTKAAGFNLCWLEAKAAGVPKIIGNENGIGIKKINDSWKEMSWEKTVQRLNEILT